MASIATTISALATFAGTVPGITHSYDLSATPNQISPSQLPCAVIDFGPGDSFGAKALDYMGNQVENTFEVTQMVLIDTAEQKAYQKVMPTVVSLIDAYVTTLQANPFYSGTTSPANFTNFSISGSVATIPYGDVSYYGFIVKHQMTIYR